MKVAKYKEATIMGSSYPNSKERMEDEMMPTGGVRPARIKATTRIPEIASLAQ